MALDGMPDVSWFKQLNKQMQTINSIVNFSVIDIIRQNAIYEQPLVQIDTMVKAMRMPLLSVSTVAQTAGLAQSICSSQIMTSMVAASDAFAAVGQSAAQAAKLFASFPPSLFDSLRRSQEVWFQAIRISDDFFRLQRVLGTNLAQHLSEHEAHYQATLDGCDAFAKAFTICHKKLHFTALKILENVYDAEDALQDAAEKALIALPTYSTGQIRHLNIEGWFITIVKRTALNQKRDKSRCSSYVPNWLEQRPGSRLDQPEAHLLRRELFQSVHEGFRALSELQHKIILLRYFDFGAEMTWEELAHSLGCTSSNARVSYKRGLATLRKHLEGMHFVATDLAEVIDAFSPEFSHRDIVEWLNDIH